MKKMNQRKRRKRRRSRRRSKRCNFFLILVKHQEFNAAKIPANTRKKMLPSEFVGSSSGQEGRIFTEDDLSGLGVSAFRMEDVEQNVIDEANKKLAEEEKKREKKERSKIDAIRKKIDGYQKELASIYEKPSINSQDERKIKSLKKKIAKQQEKEQEYEEELKEKKRERASRKSLAIIDNEDETERERLIRTGIITPFDKVPTNISDMTSDSFQLPQQTGGKRKVSSMASSLSDEHASAPKKKKVVKEEEEEYIPEQEEDEEDEDEETYEYIENEGEDEDEKVPIKKEFTKDDSNDEDFQQRISEYYSTRTMIPEIVTNDKGEEEMVERVDYGEIASFGNGYSMPKEIYDKLFGYQKTTIKWMNEIRKQGVGGSKYYNANYYLLSPSSWRRNGFGQDNPDCHLLCWFAL